ncbi:MAG: hypothetical protein MUE42_07745, partial [Opitutaceae bacterium]|nr:hypothetical protein [Opitutaceae bacterium]
GSTPATSTILNNISRADLHRFARLFCAIPAGVLGKGDPIPSAPREDMLDYPARERRVSRDQ